MSFVFDFPGGKLRKVPLAATAGNVVGNLSPGAGKRWKILFGQFTLVCDGNAADRYPYFYLTDGTVTVFDIGRRTTATVASETKKVQLANRQVVGPTDATALAHCELTLPDPCIIEGIMQFRVTIAAGLAGDSYSGFLYVLEMDM